MKVRCQIDDITPWISKEDYGQVCDFGSAEWFIALSYRLNFRQFDHQILSHILEPEQRWLFFYKRSPPTLTNINALVDHYNDPTVVDAAVAVEEIESADAVNTSEPFSEQNIRVLVIDPDAPDKELLDGFMGWLTELRKTHPLPIRVPGPKSLNVGVTQAHIGSWSSKHILECFDIDLWAEIHGMQNLAHEDLYDLVRDEIDDPVGPKDWAVEARKIVEEALKAIRLLAYARKDLKND